MFPECIRSIGASISVERTDQTCLWLGSRAARVADGHVEPLSPSVAVTAEIKTGQRSVVSYLMCHYSGIFRKWDGKDETYSFFHSIRMTAKHRLLIGLFAVAMMPAFAVAGFAPDFNACQMGQQTTGDSHAACGRRSGTSGFTQHHTFTGLEALSLVSEWTGGHDSETVDIPIGHIVLHVPRNYISHFGGYEPGLDYFRIQLLLPGLEPETPETAEEFSLSKIPPNHTVLITIRQRTPDHLSGEKLLGVRLKSRASLLKILRPEDRPNPPETSLPGGFTYYPGAGRIPEDIFARQESNYLFILECMGRGALPFPVCSVRGHIGDDITFDCIYPWAMVQESPVRALELDQKIRQLLTQFIAGQGTQLGH